MAEVRRASVVYLASGREHVLEVEVPAGSTLADAVAASGLARLVPEFDPAAHSLGVWGKQKAAGTLLCNGDRVEVYRPLTADPNIARQRRVAKKRAAERK